MAFGGNGSKGGPTKATLPAALVLALCCLTFFAGRYYQHAKLLSAAEMAGQGSGGQRKLSAEEASQAKAIVTETALAPVDAPRFDPLDSVELERFFTETSGLTRLQPPLTPAASGDNFYHAIPFQILSWYPRIVVFPAFVDKARCEVFIALAKKYLHPSGLAYKPGDKIPDAQDTRTSSGTFVSAGMDSEGALAWVEEKIAAATLIPRSAGEAFNVLRYENMQHYDSHYDTFDPKDFGPQPNQRIATVLVYLSEVLEGGETVFKREGAGNGNRDIPDWRNCDDGSLKYSPRQGDAVMFWATKPNGDIDPHALHGGCPVKAGEKWVATKWLHARS